MDYQEFVDAKAGLGGGSVSAEAVRSEDHAGRRGEVTAATGNGWELRLGDCMDPGSGLPSLTEKSVDHVITDPPYDERTNKGARTGGFKSPRALVDFDSISIADLAKMFEQAGRASKRWVLATLCIQHGIILVDRQIDGLELVRLGSWVKPNGAPQFTGDRPSQGWELVAILHPPGRKRWNGGGRPAVWTIPICHNASYPTQKPIELIEALIRDFTDRGELICDPFAGSGTTGVAALKNGRRFIGWERRPKAFEIAVKRLQATREQANLLDSPSAPNPRKQTSLFDLL